MRPVSWITTSVVTALLAAGCARSDALSVVINPSSATQAQVALVVRSIASVDGITILHLADQPDIEPGDILRLGPADDTRRMKGLAVVLERRGTALLARLTGLTDPNSPILVGDLGRTAPSTEPPLPMTEREPPTASLDQPAFLHPQALEIERLRLAETERERDLAVSELAQAKAKLVAQAEQTANADPAGEAKGPAATDNQFGLAAELATLEAERAYFDLSMRVLALSSSSAQVQLLQDRVRHELATRSDIVPQPPAITSAPTDTGHAH